MNIIKLKLKSYTVNNLLKQYSSYFLILTFIFFACSEKTTNLIRKNKINNKNKINKSTKINKNFKTISFVKSVLNGANSVKNSVKNNKAPVSGHYKTGKDTYFPTIHSLKNRRFQLQPVNGDFIQGKSNALVTVILFFDPSNLSSEKAFDSFKFIAQRYANNNKTNNIRLVLKPYPGYSGYPEKSNGPLEFAVSVGYVCSIHDKMLDFYKHLFTSGNGFNKHAILESAEQTGVNKKVVLTELMGKRAKQYVKSIRTQIEKMGVFKTPLFFINGKPVDGKISIASLMQLIKTEQKSVKKLIKNKKPVHFNYNWLLKQYPQADQVSQITYNLHLSHTPYIGNSQARIKLVFFGDFQCPFSKNLAFMLRKVMNTNKNTVLYFKNFPMKFHKQAKFLSIAGLCAARQNKFKEAYNYFFNKMYGNKVKTKKEICSILSINCKQFLQCFNKKEAKKQFLNDVKLVKSLGLKGTPALFINGRQIIPRGGFTAKKIIGIIDNSFEENE